MAALLLQGEADKWSGWSKLSAPATDPTAPGAAADVLLRLPRPFAQGYALPCRAAWVEVAGAAPAVDEEAEGAGLRPGSGAASMLHGKPKLQGEEHLAVMGSMLQVLALTDSTPAPSLQPLWPPSVRLCQCLWRSAAC